jgi:hypothetical protein
MEFVPATKTCLECPASSLPLVPSFVLATAVVGGKQKLAPLLWHRLATDWLGSCRLVASQAKINIKASQKKGESHQQDSPEVTHTSIT